MAQMKNGFNSSQLKWIAMLTMLLDHIAAEFPPGAVLALAGGDPTAWWAGLPRWIGRMAFPVFAFLLARGCDKSRSLLRYAGRLAAFSLISQIPYTLALFGVNTARLGQAESVPLTVWNWSQLNIFPTLLLGLAAVALWKQGGRGWWWRLGVLPVFFLAWFFNVQYGLPGVLLIFCLWKFPSGLGTAATVTAFAFCEHLVTWYQVPRLGFSSWKVFAMTLERVFPWVEHMNWSTFMPPLFVCLSLVLLLRYNGERGNMKKWTAYGFYPAHLLALFALRELAIFLGVFA